VDERRDDIIAGAAIAVFALVSVWIQGFAFGVGLFGVGVSWVYIALSTFGEMAEILAAIGTAGFCAYLALFPAFAGWMCARFTSPESGERLGMAAATWTIAEWLRGWVLSGFGWLPPVCAVRRSRGSRPMAACSR
jgi:apolipoprotein N-acyltransferase